MLFNIPPVRPAKPKHKPGSRKDVAYHEAGHALAVWYQGSEFKSGFREASIVYDGRSLGRVNNLWQPKWFDVRNPDYRMKLWAEKDIVASFAGEIAEWQWHGRELAFERFGFRSRCCSGSPRRALQVHAQTYPEPVEADSDCDHVAVERMAWFWGQLPDKRRTTLQAYLRPLFIRSQELVQWHWREISFVAQLLISRREVTYREMFAALDRAEEAGVWSWPIPLV